MDRMFPELKKLESKATESDALHQSIQNHLRRPRLSRQEFLLYLGLCLSLCLFAWFGLKVNFSEVELTETYTILALTLRLSGALSVILFLILFPKKEISHV